jgi:hypothetical protein
MKKDIIRTSFDLTTDTIDQADAIVKEAKLSSRKEAVEWSIRLASQVVEAFRQGLQLIVVNKKGEKKEFHLDTPTVERRATERMILARIGQADAIRLLEITRQPSHPADKVTLQLAMAAIHPEGPQYVEASAFFSLIYWAISLDDADFRALVRDVVTVCVTAFKSFEDMLTAENYKPHFDSSFPEQQFLSDQYQTEKRKRLIP